MTSNTSETLSEVVIHFKAVHNDHAAQLPLTLIGDTELNPYAAL